jgi:hypothetical protein
MEEDESSYFVNYLGLFTYSAYSPGKGCSLPVLLEVNVGVDCRNQNDRFDNKLPRGLHIQHLESGGQAGYNQRAD